MSSIDIFKERAERVNETDAFIFIIKFLIN
jgi:hypothetical protein